MRRAPITVELLVLTKNPLNNRESWRTVHRRGKEQKHTTWWQLRAACFPNCNSASFPVLVTLTRLSPKTLDPDGLAASLKHVQDTVADYLNVDDGDTTRIRWRYLQEHAKRMGVVRVTLQHNTVLREVEEAAW